MAHSQYMIAELEKGIKDEPQTMAASKSTLEILELELARAREEYKSNTRRRNREISKAEEGKLTLLSRHLCQRKVVCCGLLAILCKEARLAVAVNRHLAILWY